MFSWPPAIITCASPQRIACAAKCSALRPEPQTLLRVKAAVLKGRPACTAVWRAGFWPLPAVRTWPRITSSICSGATPVFSKRLRTTIAPNCGAGIWAKLPWKLPTAVRVAATITTSCIGLSFYYRERRTEQYCCYGCAPCLLKISLRLK